MYKAVYMDSEYYYLFNGNGEYKTEEIIGFFESIEDFKQAALERWPHKRDKVVFEDETENSVKAYFEYLGMRARPYIIVSKIEPGWSKHVWG